MTLQREKAHSRPPFIPHMLARLTNPITTSRINTYGLLVIVFLLACLSGYLVVRAAVVNTEEQQSLAIAEIVASQAKSARSVYSSEIAEKLKKDGFGASVNSASIRGHVPIPAQFLKLMGQASSTNMDRLYEYKPVSKWNLEPSQGVSSDFLRWAWPQLERQDKTHPAGPLNWRPVYRFETLDGRRILRYLSPDPASQAACVQCHNAYEKTPEIVARRRAEGAPMNKQWQLHQLLGALSISIPLDKAEIHAGAQIQQTTFFVFGILILSFLSMLWFNWRLTGTRLRLEKSELEARTANELLRAKKGVEEALSALSTYLCAIDQHAIVSVTDTAGNIVQINDKFAEISGYSQAELLGKPHRIINSRTHPPAFFAQMWATIRRGEIWRGLICNRAKSGALYWVDSAIVPQTNADGDIFRYVSIRIDVTERKRAEQEIQHMATHDMLTGLANRTLLTDRIRQAVEMDRRDNQLLAAVLFIDLDRFKYVNDSLGHAVGDLVLIEVAHRLLACVRAEDTVARQGGDELIVFLPRVHEVSDVEHLADAIRRTIAQPITIQGHVVQIGASIGVAMYPKNGQEIEALLQQCDTAMYRAKLAGGDQVAFAEDAASAIGKNPRSLPN